MIKVFDIIATQNVEFGTILPVYISPTALRQRNRDDEAAEVQRLMTCQHGLKRQGQRDSNRNGDLGPLVFPPMESFTG